MAKPLYLRGIAEALQRENVGLILRAINESATANGSMPPPAIKPMGDEICKSRSVMVCSATPSSRPVAVFSWQAKRAMLDLGNERQNFGDRWILVCQMRHALESFGKHPGAMEQLLVERSNRSEPIAGEIAALHADDVEALKRRILAVDQAERITSPRTPQTPLPTCVRSACAGAPPKAAMKTKSPISQWRPASPCREDDVVADLAIVTTWLQFRNSRASDGNVATTVPIAILMAPPDPSLVSPAISHDLRRRSEQARMMAAMRRWSAR